MGPQRLHDLQVLWLLHWLWPRVLQPGPGREEPWEVREVGVATRALRSREEPWEVREVGVATRAWQRGTLGGKGGGCGYQGGTLGGGCCYQGLAGRNPGRWVWLPRPGWEVWEVGVATALATAQGTATRTRVNSSVGS